MKWCGECSESFPVKQGVRQGGILSAQLYKDHFLEMHVLENKRLGLRSGRVYTDSPSRCDDVAFLTKLKDELQVNVHLRKVALW